MRDTGRNGFRGLRKDEKGFDTTSDLRRSEAEIFVPSLRTHDDEFVIDQPAKVRRTRGGFHAGAIRKFLGGERTTCHEQRQHANSSGVADRTSYTGDVRLYIHALIMNEASMR